MPILTLCFLVCHWTSKDGGWSHSAQGSLPKGSVWKWVGWLVIAQNPSLYPKTSWLEPWTHHPTQQCMYIHKWEKLFVPHFSNKMLNWSPSEKKRWKLFMDKPKKPLVSLSRKKQIIFWFTSYTWGITHQLTSFCLTCLEPPPLNANRVAQPLELATIPQNLPYLTPAADLIQNNLLRLYLVSPEPWGVVWVNTIGKLHIESWIPEIEEQRLL
jgi:hypothetical protein